MEVRQESYLTTVAVTKLVAVELVVVPLGH
jgi:hypothetical protein